MACIVESLLMGYRQTLIIIDKKDIYYIQGAIEEIQGKFDIEIEILPDANHSLDVAPINTSMSIRILNQVIEELEDFLE